jgi:hypothetical protein
MKIVKRCLAGLVVLSLTAICIGCGGVDGEEQCVVEDGDLVCEGQVQSDSKAVYMNPPKCMQGPYGECIPDDIVIASGNGPGGGGFNQGSFTPGNQTCITRYHEVNGKWVWYSTCCHVNGRHLCCRTADGNGYCP